MFTINSQAAQEIEKLLEEEQALHVAVRGGGCSGFEYLLSIGPDHPEQEVISGIPVYIAPEARPFLETATLGYQRSDDGLQPGGFKFENSAYTSCGCGKSFGC